MASHQEDLFAQKRRLSVSQLKEQLRERGLPVSGSKNVLVERLVSSITHEPPDQGEVPAAASLHPHPPMNLQQPPRPFPRHLRPPFVQRPPPLPAVAARPPRGGRARRDPSDREENSDTTERLNGEGEGEGENGDEMEPYDDDEDEMPMDYDDEHYDDEDEMDEMDELEDYGFLPIQPPAAAAAAAGGGGGGAHPSHPFHPRSPPFPPPRPPHPHDDSPMARRRASKMRRSAHQQPPGDGRSGRARRGGGPGAFLGRGGHFGGGFGGMMLPHMEMLQQAALMQEFAPFARLAPPMLPPGAPCPLCKDQGTFQWTLNAHIANNLQQLYQITIPSQTIRCNWCDKKKKRQQQGAAGGNPNAAAAAAASSAAAAAAGAGGGGDSGGGESASAGQWFGFGVLGAVSGHTGREDDPIDLDSDEDEGRKGDADPNKVKKEDGADVLKTEDGVPPGVTVYAVPGEERVNLLCLSSLLQLGYNYKDSVESLLQFPLPQHFHLAKQMAQAKSTDVYEALGIREAQRQSEEAKKEDEKQRKVKQMTLIQDPHKWREAYDGCDPCLTSKVLSCSAIVHWLTHDAERRKTLHSLLEMKGQAVKWYKKEALSYFQLFEEDLDEFIGTLSSADDATVSQYVNDKLQVLTSALYDLPEFSSSIPAIFRDAHQTLRQRRKQQREQQRLAQAAPPGPPPPMPAAASAAAASASAAAPPREDTDSVCVDLTGDSDEEWPAATGGAGAGGESGYESQEDGMGEGEGDDVVLDHIESRQSRRRHADVIDLDDD
ncbi:unnamed protein product [Vitrella brassicaformis CCMP3155]|uniref:SAP domain-containing protein n=3 Tax=Vitrella brassicaformis TaxID=1169539 RepID=A0A0G4EG10_VITBC|nr:unnamed protein product [Vitrella brassicaformis CCMP3155]|eukprot:CEL94375.1 unnamed protein product [Vitrella brassicaformis CCMP3155]